MMTDFWVSYSFNRTVLAKTNLLMCSLFVRAVKVKSAISSEALLFCTVRNWLRMEACLFVRHATLFWLEAQRCVQISGAKALIGNVSILKCTHLFPKAKRCDQFYSGRLCSHEPTNQQSNAPRGGRR